MWRDDSSETDDNNTQRSSKKIILILMICVIIPVGIFYLESLISLEELESGLTVNESDNMVVEFNPSEIVQTESGRERLLVTPTWTEDGWSFDSDADDIAEPVEEESSIIKLDGLTSTLHAIIDTFSSKDKTFHYSVKKIPNVPNPGIPTASLNIALEQWKSANTDIEFVESNNPEIVIQWIVFKQPGQTEVATCDLGPDGTPFYCVLDITLGGMDCNDDYVQMDENMVANSIMHGIGHALGLEHNNNKNHLMYTYINPQIPYDNLGYNIPPILQEYYVGERALVRDMKSLSDEIEIFDEEISVDRKEYEKLKREYQKYDGETMTLEERIEMVGMWFALEEKRIELNLIIENKNQLLDQYNVLQDELVCYPNHLVG